MKACICHNISDKTVRSILSDFFKGITVIAKRRGETDQPNNLDDLHEACSSGEGFNCGTCACAMADLAREHNREITMTKLRESLPEGLPTPALERTPARADTKSEPAV